MTKSTIVEIANMAPEGVGMIDLASTAILIIDMQVSRPWFNVFCSHCLLSAVVDSDIKKSHTSTYLL